MKTWGIRLLFLTFSLIILLVSTFITHAQPENIPPYPQTFSIHMFELYDDGTSTGVACHSGDTYFGCTAKNGANRTAKRSNAHT
jgi:hypothetical protein